MNLNLEKLVDLKVRKASNDEKFVELRNKMEKAENDEELDELTKEEEELTKEKDELEEEIKATEKEIEEVEKNNKKIIAEERGKIMNLENKDLKVEVSNEMRSKLEERANNFAKTEKEAISVAETRSVLVSSGKIATPTEVSGINDNGFANVSSIVDLVKITDCSGMGSYKVAYEVAGSEAKTTTEGSAYNSSDPTFDYVTIQPETETVLSSISKQARKQTPLNYEGKVRDKAFIALRKKAAAVITTKLLASSLNTTVSGITAIDEKTLRKIALNYGGSEGVEGDAYLFLNKTDLITFGDVRATSGHKNAVYEIIPDASNPNTGTIKDGGLSVKYCINSNLTAGNLIYGQPKNFELALFSDYEIAVSEDFYFDKGMLAIRGDVELGGDVVVKDGFVKVTISASTGA